MYLTLEKIQSRIENLLHQAQETELDNSANYMALLYLELDVPLWFPSSYIYHIEFLKVYQTF